MVELGALSWEGRGWGELESAVGDWRSDFGNRSADFNI